MLPLTSLIVISRSSSPLRQIRAPSCIKSNISVSSVLSKGFRVLKTEGNFNNEIGLPLTVLQIREDCEIAVLEMGISDFGEMHSIKNLIDKAVPVNTLTARRDKDVIFSHLTCV